MSLPSPTRIPPLKPKTFYLKACATVAAQDSPQLEIKPIRAIRRQGGAYFTDITAGNVRDYQNISAQLPKASLSPRADTYSILIRRVLGTARSL